MSITKDELMPKAPQAQDKAAKIQKYLIFMIRDAGGADLKLGVDVSYVMDILDTYELTYLPMVPYYVRGVFNLRGQIIPAMDMHLRLGKAGSEEKGLLIVLDYDNIQLGIIVDAVERIIDIDENEITTVRSQEAQRFASGMCTIPDQSGTMLVLNCEELFSHE